MTKISIYLDDDQVFTHEVDNRTRGRKHASAIIKRGYRSTLKEGNDLEWYPPHRIVKVRVEGGGAGRRHLDTVMVT